MKILLDIDGVLIPAKPWQKYEFAEDGFGLFNKKSVECLNEILNSVSNPEIILTTSHKKKYTIEQWKSIFKHRGIIETNINRLDSNSLEVSRKSEIFYWYLLNQNESFIIIDDDKGLLDLNQNIVENHLILTKPTIGLSETDLFTFQNLFSKSNTFIEI